MSLLYRVPNQFELHQVHFIVCVVGTIELTREQMWFNLPKNRIFNIILFDGTERLLFDEKVFGVIVEESFKEAIII